MYRSSPAKKFGPLTLLAVAQLVVVLAVSGTDPSATGDALAVGTAAGVPLDSGVVEQAGTAPVDGAGDVPVAVDGGGATAEVPDGSGAAAVPAAGAPATSGGSAGSAAAPGGGAAAAGGSAGGGGAAAPTAPRATAGSTAHCVDGRQFDPKIDFFAPPCVPGVPGAAVAGNRATGLGVSKDTITVVHYVGDAGAEVNAILRAQGLYYDATDARTANAAFQTFINKNYQLHGRKVAIRTYQGTCRTVPPDQQCLNAEMNRIAKQFKPFAVYYNTTVCSACFAELARNKVVTFGGAGFSEEFRNELKPYNYDAGMSSTRMSRLFAELWCNQMAGKPAVQAGSQNPAQDLRKVTRQLGVVSTNDPDNERVIKKVLYPALAKCGQSVKGHEYFYEQNVGTAATQSAASAAAMNTRTNPATSVVCFCDPVAPQFLYNAQSTNNYWPEALIASNQAVDVDPVAQSYMSGLACPQPQRGCVFDGALGLGQSDKARTPGELAGIKVFRSVSKDPLPVPDAIMEGFWTQWNMFASLLQAAGPELTPARMAAAAPTLGSRGGGTTGRARKAFEDGELSWTRDVYLTYFNKNRTSPFNSKKGSYQQADGGRRYSLGSWASGPSRPCRRASSAGSGCGDGSSGGSGRRSLSRQRSRPAAAPGPPTPLGSAARARRRFVQHRQVRRGQRPDDVLHDLRLRQGAAQAELGQPARGWQHRPLQGADRGVEVADGAAEAAAELVDVPAERAQPLEQLAPGGQHRGGVLGQPVLLPGVGDGAQQRQQGGRRRQVDPPGEGVLQQRRVGLQGRAEQGLPRQEQHDELRRGRQGAPVGLVGEPVDVRPQVARVRGGALGPLPVVDGLDRLQVGREGHLGVDDDGAAADQPHHEVGAQRSPGARHGRLLLEVAAVEHAGVLADAAQLQLAPAAAGLRPAQGVDERGGLPAELRGALRHGGHLLAQLGRGAHPLPVEAVQPPLDPVELVAQRLDHRLDRPGALRHVGVAGPQPGLGELGGGELRAQRGGAQRVRARSRPRGRRAGRRRAGRRRARRVAGPCPDRRTRHRQERRGALPVDELPERRAGLAHRVGGGR